MFGSDLLFNSWYAVGRYKFFLKKSMYFIIEVATFLLVSIVKVVNMFIVWLVWHAVEFSRITKSSSNHCTFLIPKILAFSLLDFSGMRFPTRNRQQPFHVVISVLLFTTKLTDGIIASTFSLVPRNKDCMF